MLSLIENRKYLLLSMKNLWWAYILNIIMKMKIYPHNTEDNGRSFSTIAP
jgi:hypothetical protein